MFNSYRDAWAAFDATPGAVILRFLAPGLWAVLRVEDITRGLVYDERARFERQFDGNWRRVR